jgi:hypothetical protein
VIPATQPVQPAQTLPAAQPTEPPETLPATQPVERTFPPLAQQIYDAALADEQAGQLLAAQEKLLVLLNGYAPENLPAGAEETLRRVQQSIANPPPIDLFGDKPVR